MTYLEKLEDLIRATDDVVKAMGELARAQREHRTAEAELDKDGKAEGPVGPGANIQKIEIIVTRDQDPDRVARLMLDQLARMRRTR